MIIYLQRNLSLLAEQMFFKDTFMIDDLLYMLLMTMLWKYVILGSDSHV